MAIEYKAIGKKVPGGPDKGQTKYYASANNTGISGLDELTTDIERASTVNGADIRAVLYGLLEAIPIHLKAGNVVELQDIGRFRISLSSKAEDAADKVTSQSITEARFIFTPSKKFKQVLQELTYKKIT